jgi:hypothetical protein
MKNKLIIPLDDISKDEAKSFVENICNDYS